jgi:CheY-like chemotaxis protein
MGGVLGEGPLPDGGSQVWFELDLPLDPAEPVIDLEPAPIASGTQPLRVLLAEDNAFSQELIKTILSPLGYQIDTVENGQSAIFAAQRNSYDLILMDIRMPGMDGHASAKAIRALGDRRAKVPIIALSAADKPSDIRECFAAGMNDHVGKPILTSALYAAIARHVKA